MNSLERKIYTLIADYPWIRKLAVGIYQRIFSIIPQPSFEPNLNLNIIEGCFYGFHDKIPWSPDNNYLLAHKYDIAMSLTQAESLSIEIGVVHDGSSFQHIAKSKCWNWQQGSMLQWLGKEGLFAFNDFNRTECITIYNASGEKIKELDGHMGVAHPDGKKILGFNFGRLSKATDEYGYKYFDSTYVEISAPKEDGLWRVDVDLNKRHLIVSLATLSTRDQNDSMRDAYHYVTHTTYNNTGDAYAFLHRWKTATGRLYSRLYVGDSLTDTLRYFPLHDSSHISWDGDSHLFIYGWLNKNTPCYISLCSDTLTATPVQLNIPNVDGHPQVNSSGLVVTDSYPDRSRLQSLYVCDPQNGDSYLLRRSKIPLKFRHAKRCDYHPRWDRTGTKICFDSASTGIRSLYIINDFSVFDGKIKRL